MDNLYSLAELEAISDGDKGFIVTMKQIFEEEMLASLDKMNRAFDENDLKTIRTTAHTMKPSIDNLHIDSIRDEIRKVESMAAANADVNLILPYAKKVDSVLHEVIAHMKATE